MLATDIFNIPSNAHENLPFVNVDTDTDKRLFIDPGLVRKAKDPISRLACVVGDSFVSELMKAYGNGCNEWKLLKLYGHCHEPNYTRLGYGNGSNGKARTPEGLLKIFAPIDDWLKHSVHLTRPEDFPLCLPEFSNDNMSDLETNLNVWVLNRFTLTLYKKYGSTIAYLAYPKEPAFYWDFQRKIWRVLQEPMLHVNGKPLLLVPKWWVTPDVYSRPEVFIRHVLAVKLMLERYRGEKGPSKKDFINSLPGTSQEIVNRYLQECPDLLEQFHKYLDQNYGKRVLHNDQLDHYTGINVIR